MPSLSPRKMPRQERARFSREAILDAAAHIFRTHGLSGRAATTNEIARKAGVSIGSLYQYFPHKEAIIAAVAERLAEQTLSLLLSTIAEQGGATLEDGARACVRAVFQAHLLDPGLWRALDDGIRPHRRQLASPSIEAGVERALTAVVEGDERIRAGDARTMAFVVLQSVVAIMRTAVADNRIDDLPNLVEETAELVVRYLAKS